MASELIVYDTQGTKVTTAEVKAGEIVFADPAMRWVWVLDARHEPYNELPLAKILERAANARKKWALVGEHASAEA